VTYSRSVVVSCAKPKIRGIAEISYERETHDVTEISYKVIKLIGDVQQVNYFFSQ